MNTENHPTLGRIIVLPPSPTGFEAAKAVAVAPGTPSEDFSDRRVFVHLESSMPATFGNLYWDQGPSGPKKAYMTRNASDAALVKFADRHGLTLDSLRAFRDQAQVGARMLATPAEALLA